MSTRSCPACGISVPADARECPDCGHVLAKTISITAIVVLSLVLVGVVLVALLLASWGGPAPLAP
jgi:predicted nucleic acid-binding Zn ribbon protein